ncbi:MAG: DUF6580 family putative transport protein [bacterium]
MAFYLSLILSVVSRLIPHPANFTPIGSLIFMNSRKSSLLKGVVLAIAIMLLSDIFLGFSFVSVFVYIGFIGYALMGRVKKIPPVLGVILGSIGFFVISNFGVFIGPWYEHSLAGLLRCFTNAIPFYRNTILADVVFVVAIIVAEKSYIKIKNKYKFLEGWATWEKNLRAVSLRKK